MPDKPKREINFGDDLRTYISSGVPGAMGAHETGQEVIIQGDRDRLNALKTELSEIKAALGESVADSAHKPEESHELNGVDKVRTFLAAHITGARGVQAAMQDRQINETANGAQDLQAEIAAVNAKLGIQTDRIEVRDEIKTGAIEDIRTFLAADIPGMLTGMSGVHAAHQDRRVGQNTNDIDSLEDQLAAAKAAMNKVQGGQDVSCHAGPSACHAAGHGGKEEGRGGPG